MIFDQSVLGRVIKDAVFINPKTYGLILNNNNEVVKIKGVNRNYVSFEKLKSSFYDKKNLTIYNMSYIKNINFKIEYRQMNKKWVGRE